MSSARRLISMALAAAFALGVAACGGGGGEQQQAPPARTLTISAAG